jgi:hypothetical protein
MTDAQTEHLPGDEPPPFGGSWKALYAVVLVNLAVLVALFYLFTRYFSG